MRTIVLAAVLLSGCGATKANDPAHNEALQNIALDPAVLLPKTTPTSLAGVDFGKPIQAFGTEPYWSLDITPDKIVFEDMSIGDGVKSEWAGAKPAIAGLVAKIATKTAKGESVTITLTGESCLEVGEEEDRLPLTAEVKIGDRTLNGCAGERKTKPAEDSSDNRIENAL